MSKRILKIGVGHLFATGNRLKHDEIFHIAGMRYSGGGPPESRDWILKLNPNRKLNGSLRNRLWEQSRVHKKLREDQPPWKEAEPEIASFFADLDVLFVYDRKKQKEWFTKIVFKNVKKQPVCVDLLEMHRFFFPGQELPNSEDIIKQYIPKGARKRNDPQLPYLVQSLGIVLQNIVSRIRFESQAAPRQCLLYSLLGKALSEKPSHRFQDFHALFQVAGIAHRILWGNELFAKPYGDKAPELIESADAWNDFMIREIVATMPVSAPATKKFGEVKLSKIASAFKISPNTLKKYFKKIDSPKTPSRNRNKAVIEDQETYLKLLNALVADEKINIPDLVNPKFVHGTFEQLFGKLPEGNESKRRSGSKGELEGFRPREEQKEFASFCIKGINRKGMYAVEAGTGTGKTLGYLAPACEFVRQTQDRVINDTLRLMRKRIGTEENQDNLVMPDANVKVIVATATKNLQDQILSPEKDWDRLTTGKTLYGDLKAAPLKGKQDFLCITAVVNLFEDAYGRDSDKTATQSPSQLVEKRLAWLFLFMILLHNKGMTKSISGDSYQRFREDMNKFLDESKAEVACTKDLCQIANCIREKRLRGKGLHRSCTSDQCLIGDCLCIYPRHLQEARNADVVVTNHHKLAWMDKPIRESTHLCLIDEADQFPDNLRNARTVALSSREVQRDFLQRIAVSPKQRRRGFAQILADDFAKKMESSRKSTSDPEAFRKAHENVESILVACEDTNSLLQDIGKVSYQYRIDNQYRIDSSMRWKEMYSNAGEQFKERLNKLADRFDRIAACWDAILRSGIYEEPLSLTKHESNQQDRIEKYKMLAEQWRDTAREIPRDYPSRDFVHVHTREKSGWKLEKIPYDLSDLLKETIYPATIFTSATLFVNESISLFSENLGASFEKCLRIDSPFDYENKVRGFVLTSIPKFYFKASPEDKEYWRRQVAGAIARLAVAMNGRTLVLFNSIEEMEDIYKKVQPVLEEHGIIPLLQNGISLAEINAFESIEESVLFGVKRFWTGVDFPGPTLSQVIVVRPPNPRWKGDPLIDHRREVMGDEFRKKYYGPAAKLQLRQGFGRLIRKEADTGLFVVLDRGILKNDLKNAVPVTLCSHSAAPDQMNWFIDEGLTHLDLKAEFKRNLIDLRNITVPGETLPAPSGRRQPAELK